MDIPKRKRYFVDLFAGCGGLSLGLEQAGFIPALVNEISPDAMETYLINRDDEFPLLRKKYQIGDVKELVDNEVLLGDILDNMLTDYGIDVKNGDLDLLVGGPPCQGYSGIGHRRSYSVEKNELPSNHLYLDMVNLIKKFSPKIFLFENVKGILSGKWTSDGVRGEIWNDVNGAFLKLKNYSVRSKLVHSKDYGVPQNRPRVLLVGIRKDIVQDDNLSEDAFEAGFLPKPSNNYPSLSDLLGELVDDNFYYGGESSHYLTEPKNEFQRKLRTDKQGQIMGRGHSLVEQEYSKHTKRVIAKFTHMLNNGGEIPAEYKTKKFAQRVLPPTWGEKGPTITATCLPDDYVHYSQPRILTVREWARLQMFPDWYIFSGKRTTGGIRRAGNPRKGVYDRELPKYTQIGNAVPVRLAKKIGAHLYQILEENDA